MIVRPMHKRWVVFTVPKTSRIDGSILYKPYDHRDSLHGAQKVWLVGASNGCRDVTLKPGDCCYVQDGFDLLDVDLELWESFRDDPKFGDLKEFSERLDGKVITKLVSEGSLLCVIE